jgi:hypothetical protein
MNSERTASARMYEMHVVYVNLVSAGARYDGGT